MLSYSDQASGITALSHDLIGKVDKIVYLINNIVYLDGNGQDEERFHVKITSCKLKPINVVFKDLIDFLIY